MLPAAARLHDEPRRGRAHRDLARRPALRPRDGRHGVGEDHEPRHPLRPHPPHRHLHHRYPVLLLCIIEYQVQVLLQPFDTAPGKRRCASREKTARLPLRPP